ncbi:MAG: hypothetical protein LBN43_03360 [Oscillospiraceae bacterium]|nr:hypothetical protein [Oscillospiraceae bacterium]
METKVGLDNLARYICDVIADAGLTFPLDVTKANMALLSAGLNYSDLGYERCKDMFIALSGYFDLSHPYPSAMFVDLKGSVKIERNKTKPENNANIFQRYFGISLTEKQSYIRELHSDIYMKDKDMSAIVLGKLTQRNEFNVDGWSSLVAFAYHNAAERRAIRISSDKKYLCFDLDLKTVKNENIYLLAIRNNRDGLEWILRGIVTKTSYNLGNIVRDKFKDI